MDINLRNKLIIEVFLPAAQQTYDVAIPPDMTIRQIVELLNPMMSDLADGHYKPSDVTLLCSDDTGTVLNENKTAADLGLKNGSRVLMI